ncbi:MAG: ABC transporter ATP-binding protein [Patescibacteria group bacterium]
MQRNFFYYFKITKWVVGFYFKVFPRLTLLYVLSSVILSLTNIFNAYILGLITDLAINIFAKGTSNVSDFFPVISLILATNLVSGIFGVLSNQTFLIIDHRDGHELQKYLHNHLRSLGVGNLENPKVSNISHRFMEELHSFAQYLQRLVMLFGDTVTFTVATFLLLKSAPLFIPIFLVVSIFRMFVNRKYIKELWVFNRDTTEQRRKSGYTTDILTDSEALKEILITGGYKYLNKQFHDFGRWVANIVGGIRRNWGIFSMISYVTDSIGFGSGIFLILQRLLARTITVGQFTFELRVLKIFGESVNTLLNSLVNLQENSNRLAEMRELFELYEPDEDGVLEIGSGNSVPSIELKNISFKYPGTKKDVLHDLNLIIRPGERIAIVGENGAGKTTLIKLLCRFYRTGNGEILIDEKNINQIKISSWFSKLGVLFQDFNKYTHLTVEENVKIGAVSKYGDEAQVNRALEKADALSFVKEYPLGLKQVLNEKFKDGIRPSTGQWQKIAIARFFYRDAPVLILDEPTASIDAVAESQIFDNIYKFIKNKTVIIVSHRFSTVRNADRIIVLDEGRIIEDGSHEQLLKLNGKYARAFKLQAKGYQ